MLEMIQLPLDVTLNDECRFDNYYPYNHQQITLALQNFLKQANETVFYLWGDRGVGKSHLLQAAARYTEVESSSSLLVDGNLYNLSPKDFVSSVQSCELLCIDNIDSLITAPEWQESIFHVFNVLKDRQAKMLVSAQVSPRQLVMQLEDLRSRLAWGEVYQINSLSDQDKVRVLQFRAELRGLKLADEVATYLLNRMPRNMSDLFQVLVTLDEASIAAQRAITIPFIKSVFEMVPK
ncbi:MAG: DnaA regulatory inactivator Hda [Coxiellaceae bacterium]|nr:DnaA regulatory inactivator Hda [Coxiellaceae bacterium]|tara:strand:- start:8354 stop:9061 length:708 start_codon:yes stop_codon:yes gene_type:complete